MMEEDHPEVKITVRKLAAVSLLEVFKDLLPAYYIKFIDMENVICRYWFIYLVKLAVNYDFEVLILSCSEKGNFTTEEVWARAIESLQDILDEIRKISIMPYAQKRRHKKVLNGIYCLK